MGSDFLAYLQMLEFIAFFAGYPLIYTILRYLSAQKNNAAIFFSKIYEFLPSTYAIAGTLYIGLQLKNIYPDYSLENVIRTIQHPAIAIWAVSTVAFALTVIAKKSFLSLLHSLVFFLLFAIEIANGYSNMSTDGSRLHNTMNIYTASLLFYIIAPITIFSISRIVLYTKDLFNH
ncbi:MAG TPA: hypothetical protein PKM63_15545 [Panacibacter sp.]|nr:hypothetical protein [Panacibacter sp.]HNP45705.1 hypothetical protein [Panacibacter sp.]